MHGCNNPFPTVHCVCVRGLKVRRLLDSHVLNSCSEVFSAFDESMLYVAIHCQLADGSKIEAEKCDMWLEQVPVLG